MRGSCLSIRICITALLLLGLSCGQETEKCEDQGTCSIPQDLEDTKAEAQASASSDSMSTLDEEIAEMERLIQLQQRKLQLLQHSRRLYLAGVRLSPETVNQNTQTQIHTYTPTRIHTYAPAQDTRYDFLLKRFKLDSVSSIVWGGALTFRLRVPSGKNRKLTTGLPGYIDDTGTLKVFDATGETALVKHLGHGALISYARFDGADTMNPVLVTADAGGEVRVHALALLKGKRILSGRNLTVGSADVDAEAEVPGDQITPTPTQSLNPTRIRVFASALASFKLPTAPTDTLVVYHRSKGHIILTSDMGGYVRGHYRNGTFIGELQVANPENGELIHSIDRSGQIVALASKSSVKFMTMARYEMLPTVCSWEGEASSVAFDLSVHGPARGRMYVGLTDGSVLVFDSRHMEDDVAVCRLVNRLLGPTTGPISAIVSGRWHSFVIQGCTVCVINVTSAESPFSACSFVKDFTSEGCLGSGLVVATAPFVQASQIQDPTVIVQVNATRLLAMESLLEHKDETWSLSWLRIPIMLVGVTLVFGYQFLKRKASRTNPLREMDFSAGRSRRVPTSSTGFGAHTHMHSQGRFEDDD